MKRVLITTAPFADKNRTPLELLEEAGIDYFINPTGRKLREDELADLIEGYDAIIAGTEPITDAVMARANSLKFISRVGVGLDNVDLISAKSRHIEVSYTAEAPAPAVADLTIGLIFSVLRYSHLANLNMHQGHWCRHFGRRISEVTIGVIGVGRIGSRVLKILQSLGVKRILLNDIKPNPIVITDNSIQFVDKETIYREADVISIHLPLTNQTNSMISIKELYKMKSDACIINTSRGGIVDEMSLVTVMNNGHLSGAAIDVFNKEPYDGELKNIDRCLLTSHMGSMSIDCRTRMEIEATEESIRFLTGKPLQGLVPSEEYDVQRQGL